MTALGTLQRLALAACLATLLSGCRWYKPPEFALNMEGRDPSTVSAEQKQAVTKALTKLFGTPDEPRVPAGVSLDKELLAAAAGPVGGDAEGNQRGLFRRHCTACHGISGDGAGPSSALLDPYPRDFRDGIFKYTSTVGGAKPRKRDLERTLLRGVAGTAMPSFAQLSQREIDALLEYVKYLSIRGQTELALMQAVVDGGEPLPLDDDLLSDEVEQAAAGWDAVEKDASLTVVPPPRPPIDTPDQLAASIARGRELYLSPDAQCVKCHGVDGDGKGEQTDILDDWNKRKGTTPDQVDARAGWFTLPIQELRPRDFRQGVFRGGGRPEELYQRIYVGIKGTPMPGAGPGPGSAGVLKPDDIWHVVDYVRSLSGKNR